MCSLIIWKISNLWKNCFLLKSYLPVNIYNYHSISARLNALSSTCQLMVTSPQQDTNNFTVHSYLGISLVPSWSKSYQFHHCYHHYFHSNYWDSSLIIYKLIALVSCLFLHSLYQLADRVSPLENDSNYLFMLTSAQNPLTVHHYIQEPQPLPTCRALTMSCRFYTHTYTCTLTQTVPYCSPFFILLQHMRLFLSYSMC